MPEWGQFTQEDPIGLAGGLNVYGFGAGDRVNFADPFGLCPPKDSNVNDCPAESSRSTWDRLWNGPKYLEEDGQRIPLLTGTAPYVSAGAGKVGRLVEEVHHLLPRQFKTQFTRVGLNIEEFTVKLSREAHRLKPDGLHTVSGGNWNQVWRDFFKENPGATRGAILDQLANMMKRIP